MERRKVRDRDDALELLGALDASSLPLPVFCRERGIDGRSLQCWQINLRRRSTPPASPGLRLVELTAATLPRTRAAYRVHLGGAVVEVDDDFHEHTLARLLRVVEAC